MKIIDILFSKKCIICGKKDHDICEDCLIDTKRFFIEKPLGNGVICAYKYSEPLRSAFLKYKFNGKKSYASGLSKLFLEKLKHINLEDYDIITYVPISRNRMRERGFNQCELISREICKKTTIKPQKILSKKNTKKQSTLTAKQRTINIANTFSLINDVKDLKILVIDDVYTTGATLDEVIRVIKKGNPKSVTGCVLFKN